MKTLNNQSTMSIQYNNQVIEKLNEIIKPKTKYNGSQLKKILESVYFEILPLNVAKSQKVRVSYLLENKIVKRSLGSVYTKFISDTTPNSNSYQVFGQGNGLIKPELVIINRLVSINNITSFYFDLIEAYQNGDIRVKTDDYLDALRELSILNNIIPKPKIEDLPNISFSLG